ncbi:MAG: hypothetical protein ACC661_10040, partial [Verrucomicrobiales bacterium]
TWRAQLEAGFSYDASFGFTDRAGVRDGRFHPFFVSVGGRGPAADFVVLPLTIMDTVLFRRLRLSQADALELCKTIVLEVESCGGLLSLLWHNDCFNDPEYTEWQDVYCELLSWLAVRRPWNATGEEIASWWRTSQALATT